MKDIFYLTVTLILSIQSIIGFKYLHSNIYEMAIYDKISIVDNISIYIIIILYVICLYNIIKKKK